VTKYNLRPNEVVLLEDDSAYHGDGGWGELTLTNLNLVVRTTIMGKGLFGKSSVAIRTFPVNQIKVYNGRAHARMDTTRGREVLEVYFLHGEEQFRFSKGGKRKIQTWIGKINEAVTGQTAPEINSYALPGADLVAGALKDTLGAFRSKLSAQPETFVTVATKCVSCGAPLSGVRAQKITCAYCLVDQQL